MSASDRLADPRVHARVLRYLTLAAEALAAARAAMEAGDAQAFFDATWQVTTTIAVSRAAVAGPGGEGGSEPADGKPEPDDGGTP
jgi:hypothetical protein